MNIARIRIRPFHGLAIAIAALGPVSAPVPAAEVLEPQAAQHEANEVIVRLDGLPTVSASSKLVFGPGGSAADGAGCAPVVHTYSTANFESGGLIAIQAGMVEQEIAAISLTLDPSEFPVQINTIETIFGQDGATVETTTEWSVLIWEGLPDDSPTETFSSDGVILPHVVLPPNMGAVGALVQFTVDPGDPDQIFLNNDGSNTISVGFRIDAHNNPPTTPCAPCGSPPFCCPPSTTSNAFLTTDSAQPTGANFPASNWLRCRSGCGPCQCPGGWHSLFSLNPNGPGGDWNIRLTYTPFSCPDEVGACCLPASGLCQDETEAVCTTLAGEWQGGATTCAGFNCFPMGACCLGDGSCEDDQSPEDCATLEGLFQGDASTCATTSCPEPTGACCLGGACTFPVTEADCASAGAIYQGNGTDCLSLDCVGACCFMPSGCVDLGEDDCATASGFWSGGGTRCATTICFPMGACCYPDGSCGDDVPEADCLAASGLFQGDGVLCSAVSCPQPTGACCLSNGNCLVLVESDCQQIPGAAWSAAMTDCTDADQNGTADACEAPPPCPEDLDGSGDVGFGDILAIIGAWGPCPGCPQDLSGNDDVDFADILVVIGAWGPCP